MPVWVLTLDLCLSLGQYARCLGYAFLYKEKFNLFCYSRMQGEGGGLRRDTEFLICISSPCAIISGSRKIRDLKCIDCSLYHKLDLAEYKLDADLGPKGSYPNLIAHHLCPVVSTV